MNYKIIKFNPQKSPSDLINAYLEFYREIMIEEYPDEDPKYRVALQKENIYKDHVLFEYTRLLAIDGSKELKVIGEASLEEPTMKHPVFNEQIQALWFWIRVEKEYRRNSIGTNLFRKIIEKVKTDDRVKFLQIASFLESGNHFCEELGGKIALLGALNRLLFKDVNWNLINEWIVSGEEVSKRENVTLLVFEEVPNTIAQEYVNLYTKLMQSVPLGELVETPIETIESRRIREEYFKKSNVRWITFVTKELNGTFSGLTEINYTNKMPFIAEQELTGVLPERRGRGLGKWLKATMLLWIKENLPEVTTFITGNADTNAPMLSINERMGFKKYKEEKCYKFSVQELINRL
ncbi:MAG TPA: hypothetical protein VMX55_10325 [candidate division Zixibacteria bacterium]|nr:hypothetical protein [candidate division Zixibacteria bacterium]